MLNSDVVAIIKSFAGITSLDVADAARQLKREGIWVGIFKLRDLSELCFLIHHKCEKKKWSSKKTMEKWSIRGGLPTNRYKLDRNTYLLAFKLLGYEYKVYEELLDWGPFKGNTRTTFEIAGYTLPDLKWCKILKKMYEKEYEKIRLIDFRYSTTTRENYEKRVMRRLF